MSIKEFEEATDTSIEDLKEDIVVFEKTLVKLDTDFIKGLIHSLELIDPKQSFFYDEIKDLYKLAEILERLDFNRNNYIINVIEKEFKGAEDDDGKAPGSESVTKGNQR